MAKNISLKVELVWTLVWNFGLLEFGIMPDFVARNSGVKTTKVGWMRMLRI